MFRMTPKGSSFVEDSPMAVHGRFVATGAGHPVLGVSRQWDYLWSMSNPPSFGCWRG